MVGTVEQEAQDKKNLMNTAGIVVRFFAWLPIWALMQFFWMLWGGDAITAIFGEVSDIPCIFLLFGVPLILPVLVEWSVYHNRKKKGWSYWRDVSEEWKKERLDELMKEQKESAMRVNAELKGSGGDKSDIRYWHGLLKDGIINESEFESKKAELLDSK